MISLPKWVYEPLPYVYAAGGLTAMFTLDTITGRLSGVLLLSAAVVVGYWRWDYRHEEKERLKRLSWLVEQELKRKKARQAWLREEADKVRQSIARRDEDF